MASPVITFRQFAVSGTNPSGYRADNSHASYLRTLGITADTDLDFGRNNITNSGINSATKVVVGCLESSGDMTTEIFNMRFWLPSVTAFGNGTTRFNQLRSSGWSQNQVVQNDSAEQTPTTLPSSGNILRNDGSGIISQSGDAQVTEWIYLSIYTGTDVPVGKKGGGGQGTFRYRLTADYY